MGGDQGNAKAGYLRFHHVGEAGGFRRSFPATSRSNTVRVEGASVTENGRLKKALQDTSEEREALEACRKEKASRQSVISDGSKEADPEIAIVSSDAHLMSLLRLAVHRP